MRLLLSVLLSASLLNVSTAIAQENQSNPATARPSAGQNAPAFTSSDNKTAVIAPVVSTVVVLGSVEPGSLSESSRAVVVMDPQAHPLAFQDLEDYLRTDSSVDIEQRGAAGVQSDISIRGSSFEQTLVLVNGFRINDAETSHFNLDLPVPTDALGAINVMHGAGSTLYGSDALGGVVDFLTLRPVADSLRLRAGVGTFGENQQALTATAVGRRWSEVLAGSRDFSSGFIADRDYRTEDVSSESRVKSLLGETDVLLAGSDRPFGANQFYGNFNSWERTKGWFAGLNQQFNERTQFALAYRRHSDIFVLFRNNPGYYKNQHIDESWEAALRRSQPLFASRWKDAASIHYGLEEDTDQIASNNLGHHGRNRGAAYVDLDWKAATRGSISLGLREEVLSGGRAVTSPMLAGSLWLHPAVKLRGSVGYGFRLPTYTDLYYSDPGTIGNANLKPESAWNYEGGADWYPNAKTAASVTVFYSKQKNAIDYVRSSASAKWKARNLVGLSFTGVEASVAMEPKHGEHVKVGWTLISGAQDSLHGLQSEYVFNYPVNRGTVDWTGELKAGIVLSSNLAIVEKYDRDAYPVWNFSVARELGRVHPYLQITNLSNTGYQEIIGVPMPGRGFVGGFEFLLQRKK